MGKRKANSYTKRGDPPNKARTFQVYTRSGRDTPERPERWFQERLANVQDNEGGGALTELLIKALWYYETGQSLQDEQAYSPIDEQALAETIVQNVLAGLAERGVDLSGYKPAPNESPRQSQSPTIELDDAMTRYLDAQRNSASRFANIELDED